MAALAPTQELLVLTVRTRVMPQAPADWTPPLQPIAAVPETAGGAGGAGGGETARLGGASECGVWLSELRYDGSRTLPFCHVSRPQPPIA